MTADEMLYRIDPDTNSVVQELPVPGIGFRFDIGHDAAWIPDFEGSVVRRVELDTGAVLAEIPTGAQSGRNLRHGHAVWVANHHAGTVTRIDPTTNEPVATIEVGPAGERDRRPSWRPTNTSGSAYQPWTSRGDRCDDHAVIANIDSTATCGEINSSTTPSGSPTVSRRDDVAVIDVHGTESPVCTPAGQPGTPLQMDGDVWLPTISLDQPLGHLVRVDPVNGRDPRRRCQPTHLRTSWAPASARCGSSHGIRAPSSGSRSTASLTKLVEHRLPETQTQARRKSITVVAVKSGLRASRS